MHHCCATMTFYAPAFLTIDHNDDENGESENGDDNNDISSENHCFDFFRTGIGNTDVWKYFINVFSSSIKLVALLKLPLDAIHQCESCTKYCQINLSLRFDRIFHEWEIEL